MKDSDYVKINSVNPLYLIIDKTDEYIEEKNGNKDLTLLKFLFYLTVKVLCIK